MTPQLLFDTPALVRELSDRIGAWLDEMTTLLRKHEKDTDSVWITEALHDRSMQLGIPLTMSCHHSGGSTADDIARTLVPADTKNERAIFTFEPDGAGFQDNIDKLEDMAAWLAGRPAEGEAEDRVGKIAYAMGARMLRREGKGAFAIDAVALRILDRVAQQSYDFYKDFPSAALKLTDDIHGLGLHHLQQTWMQEQLEKAMPVVNRSEAKSRSPAYGYFDFHRRCGVINAIGHRHEKGTWRSDALFLEHEMPKASMLACEGKPLDEVVDLPLTNGLGLMVTGIEPSGGLKPGVCIRTDAKKKLTIITKNS